MAANKLQWKRIAKGDKLPCQSFLRKKNGEILKLSTGAGVTVGQDAYYLPVDEVINVIKDYPVEESEDERIRKEIISMSDTLGRKDWIAWLEKQGELTDTPADTEKGAKGNDREIPNSSWSEEDEVMLRFAIEHFEIQKRNSFEGGLRKMSMQEFIDWLKSLKDKVLPQPKQEWSEEDEKILSDIIKDLVHPWNEYIPDRIEDEIKWLKNRLKSLRPQSHWKPSGEQMHYLSWIANVKLGDSVVEQDVSKHLNELLEDLKKLREEDV